MSELKEFDVGLGQYCEDGSPCVVAFDADRNPRLLNDEKVYLKSEADKYIADLKDTQRWHKFCKEKPSEDMMGEEFIVNNGQYSTIAEWGEGYWENDPFCGSKICDEVVWWKYLDKPEEVK